VLQLAESFNEVAPVLYSKVCVARGSLSESFQTTSYL
jgi:hypothetical protein